MSAKCLGKCGQDTNHGSGYCRKCRARKCIDCGGMFSPSLNHKDAHRCGTCLRSHQLLAKYNGLHGLSTKIVQTQVGL